MPVKQSKEDGTMSSSCDIFKVTPDGPLWVETVQDLSEARERITHLAPTFPGEYFVHSQGKVVVAESAQEWADVI
jgi:hypothetical protein